MDFQTPDLSDAHPDARVATPMFKRFGARARFFGPIATLKVHEDNALVRETLETAGQGRVLVVDGGGSLRCALVGGQLGELAVKNGWSGIVVYGCIRDSVEIGRLDVGVRALDTHPKKSIKKGAGDRDVAVTFAGVTFVPGEHLYADEDGIAGERAPALLTGSVAVRGGNVVVETNFEGARPRRAPEPEGLRAQISKAPVTAALIGANALTYTLESLWGDSASVETLARMGAVVPRLHDGLTWARVVAYAYLHFGAIHLLVNMFALFNLGAVIEPMLGGARFFVVYTLAAIAGGILVATLSSGAITAGASGAIFGLLGVMAFVFWQLRAEARDPARRKELGSVVFRLLVPNLVISLLPGVSFLGHLGGLVVGAAYVGFGIFRVPRFRTREEDAKERGRDRVYVALAGICVLATVIAIAAVWLTHRPWS